MGPLIFIGGVSGSGKSTLATSVADCMDLLFLEIDLWCQDGIDHHKLRAEWDHFWERNNAAPLAETLLTRARRAGLAGAVASFPSNAIFTEMRVQAARRAGILSVVTYGPEAACLNAFLIREKRNGRHLDEDHWKLFNSNAHQTYSATEYSAVRIQSFDSKGEWRPVTTMVGEVRQRLGEG